MIRPYQTGQKYSWIYATPKTQSHSSIYPVERAIKKYSVRSNIMNEREIILELWKESDENYITFLSQLHNNNLYQFYSKNRDTINKLIGLDEEGTDNMI